MNLSKRTKPGSFTSDRGLVSPTSQSRMSSVIVKARWLVQGRFAVKNEVKRLVPEEVSACPAEEELPVVDDPTQLACCFGCVVFKWLNKFVVPHCRTYSFPQSVQRALSRRSSKKAHMGDRFCLPTFIAIVKETATTDVHFKDSQRSRSLCAFLLIAVNTESGAVRHGWRVCSWQSTHILSRPCRRRSTCTSTSRRRRDFSLVFMASH